jgi:hypothetical protein
MGIESLKLDSKSAAFHEVLIQFQNRSDPLSRRREESMSGELLGGPEDWVIQR